MTVIAVLPSRDETATIAAVTAAVDQALSNPAAVIINADSSATPDTVRAFQAVPTTAHKITAPGLPQGKGAQILHALALPGLPPAAPVLLADTDTRNPTPAMYAKLLHPVQAGAPATVADYRRYWDEGNLTHHIARPLLAAALGLDLPQPLAGDMALSPEACALVLARRRTFPPPLGACVDGYGIDAFLITTAHQTGACPVPVPLDRTKEHAPSFPHLPAIFTQAVPVLLHATVHGHCGSPAAVYQLTDRHLPEARITAMCQALEHLAPPVASALPPEWPRPLLNSWRDVRNGTDPIQAAATLWPSYIHRVRAWLTTGALPLDERQRRLQQAHARLTQMIARETPHQETVP
ncbi:hypothetical protein ACWD5V_29390 [Streptomyces sp. NPDC002523]